MAAEWGKRTEHLPRRRCGVSELSRETLSGSSIEGAFVSFSFSTGITRRGGRDGFSMYSSCMRASVRSRRSDSSGIRTMFRGIGNINARSTNR